MKGSLFSYALATALSLGCQSMILETQHAGAATSPDPATAQNVVKPAAKGTDKVKAIGVAEIAAYEQKFFDRTFDGEPNTRRLDRLENFIFGATSLGTSQVRIAKIAQVVPLPTKQANKPAAAQGQPATQIAKATPQQEEPALESPGNYPHITALEAKILNNTYPGQPLPQRLSRLETKVFGSPSKGNDLEARTDAIDRYMQAQRKPKDMMIGRKADDIDDLDDNDDLMAAATSVIPRTFGYTAPNVPPPRIRYENADEDAGTIVKEQTIQQELKEAQVKAPPTPEERTLSRIAWCEQQIFGHAYPEMHLLKRLHQLNHELFPNDKESDLQLMDHIDTIVKEVVLRKQPHQPSTT